jgi:disulfide bond formation protein DsbB
MALLRTIIAFVIIVILAHLGLVYAGIDENLNGLTSAIHSLGRFLEIPAQVVIDFLPTSAEQQQSIAERGLYFIGLATVGGYFVLFLLLGIGRR